jgi:tetracycline repressor-like protein
MIAERDREAHEAATVLERGIERGELRPDLDIGVAIDALYGAVCYRLLVSHAPLDATVNRVAGSRESTCGAQAR